MDRRLRPYVQDRIQSHPLALLYSSTEAVKEFLQRPYAQVRTKHLSEIADDSVAELRIQKSFSFCAWNLPFE
jgi:hypothetical protein